MDDKGESAKSHRDRQLLGRLGKALGITLLAFLLSFLFVAPFASATSSFFATPEKNDFTVTDLYSMVADRRAVSRLNDKVVIVNIDTCGRDDIADILQMATLAGAAGVGLDVVFEEEREGDAYLLEALRRSPRLVIPVSVVTDTAASDSRFRLDAHSYFTTGTLTDTLGGDITHGASNLPAKYDGGVVREMQTCFPLADGDTILSFAVELARLTAPEAYGRLRARGNTLEKITYHSRRFARLEPSEVMENPDTLTGRIVLIGALTERADLHPTPSDVAMPGVLIHAHSLATILDDEYMSALPEWADILIGFAVCFLVVFTHVSITSGVKGLVLRILQLVLLWLIIQAGYWAFATKDLLVDVSYALLMLAFGLFACDIWNGFAEIIKYIRKRHSRRRSTASAE